MRVRDGRGKWILRQLFGQYVPPAIINRRKLGFSIPLDAWLRGPLRDWAEALLAPAALARSGRLDPAPIRRAWREHLSGRRRWQSRLWSVLMFQAWLEAQG
jgi:asparagine synthase (glutamine-hydrolysing)